MWPPPALETALKSDANIHQVDGAVALGTETDFKRAEG